MRLAITHETIYRFDRPVVRAIQTLRLTPRNFESQLVQSWRIDVSRDCRLSPVEDAFGNLTHAFSIDGPIDELSIVATGRVVTADTAGVLHTTRDRLPLMAYRRETERTRIEAAVRAFADEAAAAAGRDPLATLHALMNRLNARIAVVADAPQRSPEAVLAAEAATDVDLAHLFAAAARHLDLPTRCVSGWVWADDAPVERPRTWVEAHLGGTLGWVGFDPVADECPTDRWVRVAAGLDALDILPVRGARTPFVEETVATRVVVREIAGA